MAKEIRLPQLGQTMEEGTIVNVMVSEGDKIEKGDVIFEVETDKATLEMESPAEGYVKVILAKAEETLPVNAPLLVIGDENEEVSAEFLDSLGVSCGGAEEAAAAPAAAAGSDVSVPDSVKLVRLPQLGQTMEEGTIVNVIINEGDTVEKGDVIFEVETDKATLEMESPIGGVVGKVLAKADETLAVNAPLAVFGDGSVEITCEIVSALTGGEAAAGAAGTSAPAAGSVEAPDGAKVVKLPQLGQTMEEGTFVTIMISEGDEVAKGDVIFEVETDKATLEMESPEAGCVKAILVEQDETVAVGNPIIVLGDAGVEVPQAFIDSLKGAAPAAPAVAAHAVKPAAAPRPVAAPVAAAAVPAGGRIFATPRAKMTAAELGVNLATVQGSGPVGRIVEADVRKAAAMGTAVPAAAGVGAGVAAAPQVSFEPAAGAPQLGERYAVSKFQKITADKMVQSKRDIPCFYLSVKTDVTEMVKLRGGINAQAAQGVGVKVSFNDFIIRAVALGLRKFPAMLGQLDGEFIKIADAVHVGLAMSVEDGLAAPLIRDADQKNLAETATYAQGVIGRAKSGTLGADDVMGGCITISSLGGFGIDSFIPIVVPGQGSILGVGKISDTCVPIDGNIMVRKIMDMTLSSDHKVVNGTDSAAFLGFVKQLLENPQLLI